MKTAEEIARASASAREKMLQLDAATAERLKSLYQQVIAQLQLSLIHISYP